MLAETSRFDLRRPATPSLEGAWVLGETSRVLPENSGEYPTQHDWGNILMGVHYTLQTVLP
jgi:hypothetical protein